MTTCLGKSCSFGLPRVFRKLLSVYVFSYFPFGFESRIWDLIVSVPVHCLSFYFHCSIQCQSQRSRPAELYGPRQANLVLITYASSDGSGEPAHPRSLARTFAARSYKQ